MDFDDSPTEAAFRAEARAWLQANARLHPEAVHREAGHVNECRAWQARLFQGGWAGITWPVEYGGRGGTAVEQMIFSAEQAGFDVATGAFAVGLGMVGPTLIAHGSDSQKKRYLEPLLRGEEIWCQLFSEPGSGSDLASLSTTATPNDRGWKINGQKVWTSGAQHSDWAILLARTDKDAPRHQGISYFVLDMRSPGIEVRPLRQMDGESHFNEVFLTDVLIGPDNLIGPLHGGWSVARTTLGSERAMIGGGNASWSFDDLVALARTTGASGDAMQRQGLAAAYTRKRILGFLGLRAQTAISQGRMPGAEASVLKLAYSLHSAAVADLFESVLGPVGMLMDNATPDNDFWQRQFLGQFAVRIGGGTDQIQRNVIGERVLGLPRT
ncbi:MAG: acyl-CoA dehydrogenase family protein [Acidimicrobiales bacterium]